MAYQKSNRAGNRRHPRGNAKNPASRAHPSGYPFRRAFNQALKALLRACPKKGLQLQSLHRLGNKHWQACLGRFLQFLSDSEHVIIDYTRKLLKPLRLAQENFYQQLLPTFAVAC